MADVEGNVDITVEGAGALRDAAEAARSLAAALKDAEASAGSISGAFGSAAEAAGKLRNDAEEAAKALKSIRDAGLGVGDVAATLGGSSEAASKLRDDLGEAEDALASLVATGPGAADIAAFLEADESAAASLRTALQGVADAEAEVAAGGAGMGDGAAGLEAEAAAAGHLRDNLIEADAAQSGMAGHAGSIEKTVADMRGTIAMMEQGQTALVSKIGPEQFGQVITKDATELEILGGGLKNVKTNLDDLGDSAASRLDKLNLTQDFQSAGQAMGDYEKNLKSLKDTLADAEKGIDASGGAFKDSGDAATDAAEKLGTYKDDVLDVQSALENFFKAQEQAKSGSFEDLQNLGQSLSELRGQLERGSASGRDFAGAADDVDAAVSDASAAVGDFAPVAGDAAAAGEGASSAVDGLGASALSAATGMAPMAGLIGSIAIAATGVVPAVAAAGAGLVGFGLLGAPALEKVKAGYTAVTTAQQAYRQAVLVEKNDPTKDNLTAEKNALASLKATWQQMPAPIAKSVSSIQQFGHEFSKVSKDSGIQKDVLGDIPKAIKVATDALPSLSSLAKSTAPVISGMFKDLDKDVQSPAFKNFMKSIDSDVAPASSALHKLAGAAGGFISTLQEKGGGASNQFISSLSSLIKTATPEAVSGLVNGVKTMTNAMNGLNHAMNDPGTKKAGDIANDVWHGLATGFHEAMKFNTASGNWLEKAMTGQIKLPSWNAKWGQTTVQPKVDVKPQYHIDPDSMKAQLTHPATAKVQVKPEVKVAAPGGLMAQLEKLLGDTGKDASGKAVQVPIEAKVSKVDTSGLKDGDIKVPVTAKIDKVDTSAAVHDAAPIKLSGATLDLSSAKIGGLSSISSSLSSAGSQAGHSFDTGVASGITSGAGAATSAAQHVVTEIKASLSTLGAAGSAAGAALGAGLAAGIAASTGAAVAAATKMASEVTAAVKAAHATASPSKVFKGIGADDVKGLIQGLEGGKSELDAAAKDMAAGVTAPFKDTEITDTIKKLETDLKDSLKAGDISKTEDTGVSAWLDYDNKRLMNLASQRKNIEAAISAEDSLYKTVDQATIAGANVVTFAGNVTSGASSGGSSSSDGSSSSGSTASQPTAAYQQQQIAQAVAMANQQTGDTMNIKAPASLTEGDSIQGQLKQYLSQTRSFTSDIKKLKAEGLDSTSLQQLLQAGVSGGGLSGAQMLLSGGPKGVKEVASLQNQISQAAKQLGTTGANAAYESGSQIGGGLASGLKAELGSVTDAIKSLATSIVDEMQKGLSSGALENIGKDWASQIAKGMAGGGSGGGGGGSAHAAPILAAAGGGGGGTIHVHLNVGGTEIAQVVQTYTLQHARRNTGSGLQLRGRGT